jgi:hypothetical protein
VIIPLALIFLRREPEDIASCRMAPCWSGPFQGMLGPPHSSTLWRWCRTPPRCPGPDTRRSGAPHSGDWCWAFSLVLLDQTTVGVHRIPASMDCGIDPTMVALATALDAAAAGVSLFNSRLPGRSFQVRYL